MRPLPVRLPPPAYRRPGGPWRSVFFFLVAFLAVFVGAIVAMDLLAGALA